ncbi:flagellar FliJ family protein [Microbaculum marinum]|uniref:Flagellar FliJ family protein n=1 Tax=Microbaculum marinum TaxID=1764581 RepID=A0AAW9S3D6_9HYPH
MKSRENLIRLKRFQADEKRRQVMQIETMIADFARMVEELDRQILEEERRVGVDDVTHFAYPTFAKAAAQRRDNLKGSIAGLEEQLATAREAFAEAHEELKKVELLQERNQDRERGDDAQAMGAEMGTIGLAMRAG